MTKQELSLTFWFESLISTIKLIKSCSLPFSAQLHCWQRELYFNWSIPSKLVTQIWFEIKSVLWTKLRFPQCCYPICLNMFTDKNSRRFFTIQIILMQLLLAIMYLRILNILVSKSGCGKQNVLKLDNFIIGYWTEFYFDYCLKLFILRFKNSTLIEFFLDFWDDV